MADHVLEMKKKTVSVQLNKLLTTRTLPQHRLTTATDAALLTYKDKIYPITLARTCVLK